jgi:hypothetical protein
LATFPWSTAAIALALIPAKAGIQHVDFLEVDLQLRPNLLPWMDTTTTLKGVVNLSNIAVRHR